MPQKLAWNNELIGTFWTGVAQTRLDELSFSRLAGSQVLEMLQPHLEKGARILDFGAGDGDFSGLLVERGFNVAVFEPSAGRRANLQSKPFAQRPNFLGFTDGTDGQTFDIVLMLEVIEHISDEDMPGVLQTIASKLKPGGRFIVSTPHQEDLELAEAYCPVCDHTFHRWQHLQSWTSDRLMATLMAQGFKCNYLYFTDFSYYGSRQREDLQQRYDRLLLDYTALSVRRASFGVLFFRSLDEMARTVVRRLRNMYKNYRRSEGKVLSASPSYTLTQDDYVEYRGSSQNHLLYVGTKVGN